MVQDKVKSEADLKVDTDIILKRLAEELTSVASAVSMTIERACAILKLSPESLFNEENNSATILSQRRNVFFNLHLSGYTRSQIRLILDDNEIELLEKANGQPYPDLPEPIEPPDIFSF